MQEYQLNLVVQQRPEVVERILRVIRHRGFVLTQMTMQLENDEKVRLKFSVKSDRALSLLTNQLVKLYDVLDVTS